MEKTEKFTALHRALHWLTALAITVLFLTGFLRMTWMDKKKVAEIIASKTDALSGDEMISIAKAVREPMWEWHVIFAYVMITVFAARLIYMAVKGIRFPNPFDSKISIGERFQGISYVYFYFLVAGSVLTGICLKFGFFDEFHKQIEGVHKWGLYLYPIFFLIHFVGIAIGEHGNKRGVVSKMIGGEK
ncbi:MAG: cytochrome b/b6 domain-containing protein [Flavobacteriia bacterium]|nr:cytochrome b/b6 domain-containing protein [Flavobacteriia bacterium]